MPFFISLLFAYCLSHQNGFSNFIFLFADIRNTIYSCIDGIVPFVYIFRPSTLLRSYLGRVMLSRNIVYTRTNMVMELNGILRTWQLPVSLRFAETARAAVGECIATSHLFPCQVPRVAGAVADVPTEKSQGFALEG